MSCQSTHLIHKLKANPPRFQFSLDLRSLLLSISIRFTFMLSIHSFLSSCCQVLGCGMRKGRVSSPSLRRAFIEKKKAKAQQTEKGRPKALTLSLSLLRRLLWSFLFRLVLRRWLLWYATEVFRRFCATSKKEDG